MKKNECVKCQMSHKDPLFWETHQTMSDGRIWCATKSIVDKAKAQVKAKYGNKRRHRQ